MQLLTGLGLADADRGTQVGGLDEDRQTQLFLDAGGDGFRLFLPVLAQEDQEGHLRNTGRLPDRLHQSFVHTHRRTGHAGAHVGDVGHFQQTLQGAVFAVSSVDDREDDVHRG